MRDARAAFPQGSAGAGGTAGHSGTQGLFLQHIPAMGISYWDCAALSGEGRGARWGWLSGGCEIFGGMSAYSQTLLSALGLKLTLLLAEFGLLQTLGRSASSSDLNFCKTQRRRGGENRTEVLPFWGGNSAVCKVPHNPLLSAWMSLTHGIARPGPSHEAQPCTSSAPPVALILTFIPTHPHSMLH